MRHETRQYEFVVVGGGMAGVSAAVFAARRGLRTALLQDRPVLGGNGSKEIRVWLHGANGGQNNRFFRETGLMEELRLENLYRNPLGNAELWDAILLEAVVTQENLDLYLNTAVTDVAMTSAHSLASVNAFTLASERQWTFEAPLFADCTGDGTIALLAGAEYRSGREARSEFSESLAPVEAEPYTLGGSILFGMKDAGRPVPFIPPKWVHRFSEEDLRFRRHRTPGTGHEFWWLEYGGELDTIHDNEQIKFELLRIVYGMYDHVKNSPEHAADMANYTLEWVGTLPGKRESRRFLGDYLMAQQDILEQPDFEDAIAIGGWNIDHHPPGGFFSQDPPCFHFHIPGVYNIPFRSLYCRDVRNLMLAGRNISATHVAMCTTRVMLTCAQMGEAVGAAAFHCRYSGCLPAELVETGGVYTLQQDLLRSDHYILGVRNEDSRDLARAASVSESSLADASLETADGEVSLEQARALMLPLAGKLEHTSLLLRAEETTRVRYALHAPNPRGNFIPGPLLFEGELEVPAAQEASWTDFPTELKDAEPGFYWIALEATPGVILSTTREKLVGVLTYVHAPDWEPDPGPWAFDRHARNAFSPWRKTEVNLCFRTDAWMPAFYAGEQVVNGFSRAHRTPNIWVSAPTDFTLPEWLEFQWETPREVGAVYLYFNTDLDLDLRNIWHEYDFRTIPECARHYRVLAWQNGNWKLLVEERENYHRYRVHRFPAATTDRLRLEIAATHGSDRAQVYEVRVYGPEG